MEDDPVKVILTDKHGNELVLDSVSFGVPVINQFHEKIHLGYAYGFNHILFGVEKNSIVDLMLQVPNIWLHLNVSVDAVNEVVLRVFEDVGFTDRGSPLTPVNRNRIVGENSLVGLSKNPVLSGSKKEVFEILVPGGKVDMFEEIVLKPNASYLIEALNISDTKQNIGLNVNWCENGSQT
jgi:hypothetical protein